MTVVKTTDITENPRAVGRHVGALDQRVRVIPSPAALPTPVANPGMGTAIGLCNGGMGNANARPVAARKQGVGRLLGSGGFVMGTWISRDPPCSMDSGSAALAPRSSPRSLKRWTASR